MLPYESDAREFDIVTQFATRSSTKKNKPLYNSSLFFFSDPAGTRTQDPYIKSVLLYQLSYGIIPFLGVQK